MSWISQVEFAVFVGQVWDASLTWELVPRMLSKAADRTGAGRPARRAPPARDGGATGGGAIE